MTCGNLEIIVTLKNSGELRCLNPKSKFAQNFIKNAKKIVTMKDTAEERCMNPKSKQAQNIISNLLKKRYVFTVYFPSMSMQRVTLAIQCFCTKVQWQPKDS
ncbi:UNVERIFIED_CONTAM: hypothetical protein FKN15_078054 [Acipenser sinensis]